MFATQLHAVVDAVRRGELTEDRIDASLYRILDLKRRRGLFRDPYADEARLDDLVGTPAHLAAVRRAADAATTLVKNDARLLPLEPGPRDVLVTGWGPGPDGPAATLAAELGRRGAAATVHETGLSPGPAEIGRAVAAARGRDLVIAVTNRAWDVQTGGPHNGPGQTNLVKALAATGTPVIVIAARDPHDIAWFTEVPTYLAAYSHTTEAIRAAAATLFGDNPPKGRLPVPIPVHDRPGRTLYPFGHGLAYPEVEEHRNENRR